VSARQTLHGIGDKFAGDERVFHTLVTHGDTVANADSRHHDGVAARRDNALFHRPGDLGKVRMPGDNLALSAHYAHKRLGDLVVRPPERFHKRPMRRFVRSRLDFIAVHVRFSVFCVFV